MTRVTARILYPSFIPPPIYEEGGYPKLKSERTHFVTGVDGARAILSSKWGVSNIFHDCGHKKRLFLGHFPYTKGHISKLFERYARESIHTHTWPYSMLSELVNTPIVTLTRLSAGKIALLWEGVYCDSPGKSNPKFKYVGREPSFWKTPYKTRFMNLSIVNQ